MDERIKALEGILPYLSDDVVRGIKLALEVLVGVYKWPQEKPIVQDKAEIKKEEPAKQTSTPAKRTYNYKPKQCESCGKEFKPRYGAQKICDECTNNSREIKEVAKELFESE